eukprot:435748-Prymnesium_polylepis.2
MPALPACKCGGAAAHFLWAVIAFELPRAKPLSMVATPPSPSRPWAKSANKARLFIHSLTSVASHTGRGHQTLHARAQCVLAKAFRTWRE